MEILPARLLNDVANNTNFLSAESENGTFLEDRISLWPEWLFTYIHIGANERKVDSFDKRD